MLFQNTIDIFFNGFINAMCKVSPSNLRLPLYFNTSSPHFQAKKGACFHLLLVFLVSIPPLCCWFHLVHALHGFSHSWMLLIYLLNMFICLHCRFLHTFWWSRVGTRRTSSNGERKHLFSFFFVDEWCQVVGEEERDLPPQLVALRRCKNY